MRQEIFVFGSNLAGRHGAGAAKYAHENYNAEYGVGEGLTGNSYALPTKDKDLKTLPLSSIEESMKTFLRVAFNAPEKLFLLTPIGTGLAGYNKRDIWSILCRYETPSNVVLTSSWING